MSGPITWRNVEGPSFRDINQGMANSAAMFSNAFSGLKDVLKEREATDLANWEAMKERNTTDILTRAAAAATPEEAKALKAELLGRMQGMGAQVDSRAVLPVVQGMEAKLQDQAVKSMQYLDTTQKHGDAQKDRQFQDNFLTIQGILTGAKTQGEVEAGTNALQALLNAGQITPNQAAQLKAAGATRADFLTKRLDELASSEAQRKHLTNQDNTAAERARVDALEAAGRLQTAITSAITDRTNAGNKDAAKVDEKATDFEKNSPYGGNAFSSSDTKNLYTFGTAAGADKQDIGQFIEEIQKRYPTGKYKPAGESLAVPITEKMVQMAIASGAATSSGAPSTYFNGRDSEMMDSLKSMLESPSFVSGYRDYENRKLLYATQAKTIKEQAKADGDKIFENGQPFIDRLDPKNREEKKKVTP